MKKNKLNKKTSQIMNTDLGNDLPTPSVSK